MPSVRSLVVGAVASLAAVAQAYTIDPNSVPLGTRQAWCDSEKSTCPIICQQMEPRTVLVNTCDPKKLTYECLCGNKQQPNMSEYTLSLPYFICQEWGNQCVPACKGDNTCEADCREKHPCGATAPKKYNATSTTSAGPSATQTEANTIYSDRPGGGAGSSGGGSSGAPAALEFGRSYGLAAVMVGLFGGFALL